MFKITHIHILLFLSLLQSPARSLHAEKKSEPSEHKKIASIVLHGNTLVSDQALLARLPFRQGDPFYEAKSGDMIRKLYDLKYFNDIVIETEDISDHELILHITVAEKKKIESVTYEGTYAITPEEIEKALGLKDVPALDDEELGRYVEKIKALYRDKNYHATTVVAELHPTDRGTYRAVFTICEGPVAAVRRVIFEGNTCIPSYVLRSLIFTREDWLFGFVNKAGTYKPEMLDVDKYIIENHYQTNGYLAARVVDIDVALNDETQEYTVTYTVEEGPQFTISKLSAPGNDLISEENLLSVLPLAVGQLYSKEFLRESIDRLKNIWGRFGYIYADIEPIIIPNFDTKTVEITLTSDLGSIFTLNRITIFGNKKTCDYVIRRNITLIEGQTVSTPAMEDSKSRIESLGYFDKQQGVTWKTKKISQDEVDLELHLKEERTGSFNVRAGYGGLDPQSPSTGFNVSSTFSDRNLLGTGVNFNINSSYSRKDHMVTVNIFQPWLFNRPIGGGLEFNHRSSFYEDVNNISAAPQEQLTGGNANLLFFLPGYPTVSTAIAGGVQRLLFQQDLEAQVAGQNPEQQALFQTFINQRFASGTAGYFNIVLSQDVRNHPIFPNKGYNWSLATRVGIPSFDSPFGFAKVDFDATWLTPLIGQYGLVYLVHGHAGYVTSLRDRIIPYRDLYNIGGPGSVRGFEFGQIGPQVFNSSVGGSKAFWVNSELIFSVTEDQAIRGLVFYDGGAGWDTPLNQAQRDLLALPGNSQALTNNRFKYRHSVGFGLRFLKPAPIRIDWGFKLDRNRRAGESFYEVHFMMEQGF